VADRRTTIYALALIIAFAAYAAGQGAGRGWLFWTTGALGCAGVAAGLLAPARRWAGTALGGGAMVLGALALLVPIGLDWIGGRGDLATLSTEAGILPSILVLVFASRLVATATEVRFAAFWADPFVPGGPVQAQSAVAALLFAAALTLGFQSVVPLLRGAAPGGAGDVVTAALAGSSAIHEAIIALFFTILALLADQARLHLGDRRALRRLRELGRIRSGDAFRAVLAHARAAEPDSALLHRAARLAGISTEAATPATGPDGFRRAGRQFVRNLIPLLPLLGFLGTVVGLAIAMAELPRGLGSSQQGFDVSASLAGLAVKFETTLLGILASMVAGGLVAVLERRESETAAEADRLVEVAIGRGAGHATGD
jgi:hypothetical protein